MPAVTRIGDADVAHCSGMVRAQGSGNVFVNKKPVSRQGDVNTTHLLPGDPCPSHAAPIAAGSGTVFVNNKGVVRNGDQVGSHAAAGCGPDNSTLSSYSGSVFANNKEIARIGDEYTSDNIITSGSANVFAN